MRLREHEFLILNGSSEGYTWKETARMRRRAMGSAYCRYLVREAASFSLLVGIPMFLFAVVALIASIVRRSPLELRGLVLFVLLPMLLFAAIRVVMEVASRKITVTARQVIVRHQTTLRRGQKYDYDRYEHDRFRILTTGPDVARIEFRAGDNILLVVGATAEDAQALGRCFTSSPEPEVVT